MPFSHHGWLVALAAAGLILAFGWRLCRRARAACRRRFERLFEHCPLPCHETDALGVIRRVNQAECAVLGYSRGQILGRHCWEFVPEAERPGFQQAVLDKLAGRRAAEVCERTYVCRDGGRLTMEVHEDLIASLAGRIAGIGFAMVDVTERKRVQAEMSAALAAACEATAMKSRFVANISHEIRTPMNGVVGMTELLLATPLDGEQREYALAVRNSAQDLLTIVNDILDFSKIEAGRMELESIPFDLGRLIDAVRAPALLRSAGKAIRFSIFLSPDAPRLLMGDPVRLKQVLTNLVANAIKFTERGLVEVRVEVVGRGEDEVQLQFSVRDTGIGIRAEMLPHIFEGYHQAESSTARRYGGTGLGLSIAKQLVEMMGGEIFVDSTPGRGSTFWFRLSLSRPPDAAPAAEAAAAPAPEHAGRGRSERRVLLAEDNAINQKIALRILEKAGYKADAVSNGRQAVEACSKARYDLVLMDIHMPEMDGFEATAQIRKLEGAVRAVPIVAMTANAMTGDRERCLNAGMDDYVSKPVHVEELRRLLTRWLDRA